MLKRILAPTIIFLLMLPSSVISAQKTALELNNSYSSVSDTLYQGGVKWGTALNEAVQNGDYSKLSGPRMEMLRFIDRKTKEITASPIIGGSEKFKAAMLHFLAFEKDMANQSFSPFEKLNAKSTKEELTALIEKMTTNSQGEAAILADVQKTQAEYAKRNGFSIETEEVK